MPTLVGKEIGATGFGLMGMTWRPTQTPDEQAFAAMKAAIANGTNFWNGGEFYGTPEPTLNLQLLNRYFTAHPEDESRVVLSVKGGIDFVSHQPNGSAEGVRKSVDNVLRILDGKKHLDIFQCARVDPKVFIEETIAALAEYVKAGKISGIGLSECAAESIRRAHKVHPIASVEVEFSLWSTEIVTNGVVEACAELGIPIVAYAPLGRGFLSGHVKSPDDIEVGDIRKVLDRFQPENFKKNLDLVDAIGKVADRKGVTKAQLALAWVRSKSEKKGFPVMIPIPGATVKERVEENAKEVTVTEEEIEEIEKILASIDVVGGRYNQQISGLLFGLSK
ncbi:hypothetical protein RUND412_010170 [Rhizina undulata]